MTSTSYLFRRKVRSRNSANSIKWGCIGRRWKSMNDILAFAVLISSIVLVRCQVPGPPSVLKAIRALSEETNDASLVKLALRAAALPRSALHAHEDLVDKQDRTGFIRFEARREKKLADLEPLVLNVLHRLDAAAPSVSCTWDSSVHIDYKGLVKSKYLLAANFKDNADVMPHILREIWILTSLLPSANLFVSIYESGSSDGRTGQWLTILSHLLKLVNVHHRIITEGEVQRQESEGRIAFLSKVRNKAIEPLWENVPEAGIGRKAKHQPWPADRIIYMNDVYACSRDFIRLMLHKADMVCGLDFWQRSADQTFFDGDTRKELMHTFRRRHLLASIYDLWVLRDSDGLMFGPQGRGNNYTAKRLAAGLPFPVTTCWNGMVILPAKPFQQGLRFRDHVQDECRASECSLVCHDLHRLGYGRILVDPAVRLAYEQKDAAGMRIEEVVNGIATTTWKDVRQGPIIEAAHFQQDSEMCCNLDELDWSKSPLNCNMRSFIEPNFTAVAFPSL